MFKKITNDIIEFIRDYYNKNNLKGAIIGVSGGKDSSVVLTLFTRALGSNNVKAIWIPCHSKRRDYLDAKKIAKFNNVELITHDITNLYDNFVECFKINNKENDKYLEDSNINIKPRLRMSTLYYYAQYFSKKDNGIYLVPGTSNKSEIFVGYFTKGGDNVCDIKVLSDLLVSEVIEVGKVLGIDDSLLNKIPDDGLSGKSDEDKLGIKYSEIEDYLKSIEIDKNSKDIIERLHRINSHKFNIPEYRRNH